jgi:hypothetical protein
LLPSSGQSYAPSQQQQLPQGSLIIPSQASPPYQQPSRVNEAAAPRPRTTLAPIYLDRTVAEANLPHPQSTCVHLVYQLRDPGIVGGRPRGPLFSESSAGPSPQDAHHIGNNTQLRHNGKADIKLQSRCVHLSHPSLDTFSKILLRKADIIKLVIYIRRTVTMAKLTRRVASTRV